MSVEHTGTAWSEVDWPLRTQRLTVRPARPDDAEAVWEYRRRADVARWLGAWVRDHALWPEFFEIRCAQTLVIERDGVIIGDLMLRITDGWAQLDVADQAKSAEAELGWVIHPDHSSQGFATEAVTAVIRLCFAELGLRRITANCFAANEPSWRLMERLGMRREATSRQDALHRELGWLDGYGYALLAEEWRAGGGG